MKTLKEVNAQLEEVHQNQLRLMTEKLELGKTKASISAQITEAWIKKQKGEEVDNTWLKGAHFKKSMITARMQEINIEDRKWAMFRRELKDKKHELERPKKVPFWKHFINLFKSTK